MGTGFKATFVISWSQTEVDGASAVTLDMLTVGAAWRWTGSAVPVSYTHLTLPTIYSV